MKELPKVLIFIDWYAPGYKAGGPIQSCINLVSHLKEEFSFYVITRNTDYTATTPYATVASDSWNAVDGAQVYYASKQVLGSSTIRVLLREVEPDVVYVNGIYSFYFSVLPVIISRQLGYRHVLVAGRGMLAKSAIHVKSVKKRLFFKLAKLYKLYRGVTFHATNQAEASDIKYIIGNDAPVRVAPNLPKLSTGEVLPKEERKKVRGELSLVSIARIAPEKNTKFALEVLQRYKGKGRITFDLYGPVYQEAYWEECKAVIAQMPHSIAVRYKGSLEKEKVSGTLQQYHALYMPTKGENFGHIILESFMVGCPVLISDQTPWSNLVEKGVGYDIALADLAAYHKAISELIDLGQEQYTLLSERAYQFAAAYCQDGTHLELNRALFAFDTR